MTLCPCVCSPHGPRWTPSASLMQSTLSEDPLLSPQKPCPVPLRSAPPHCSHSFNLFHPSCSLSLRGAPAQLSPVLRILCSESERPPRNPKRVTNLCPCLPIPTQNRAWMAASEFFTSVRNVLQRSRQAQTAPGYLEVRRGENSESTLEEHRRMQIAGALSSAERLSAAVRA